MAGENECVRTYDDVVVFFTERVNADFRVRNLRAARVGEIMVVAKSQDIVGKLRNSLSYHTAESS